MAMSQFHVFTVSHVIGLLFVVIFRRLCTQHASEPNGQLPRVPETYAASASRNRIGACSTAYVRKSVQNRQGKFMILCLIKMRARFIHILCVFNFIGRENMVFIPFMPFL